MILFITHYGQQTQQFPVKIENREIKDLGESRKNNFCEAANT
jgi:hypothetical protein